MRRLSPLAACVLFVLSACVPHLGNSPAPFMAVAREGSQLELLYFRCHDELLREVSVQRIDEVLGGGRVSGPVLWQVRSAMGEPTDHVILGETPAGFDVTIPLEGQLPLDRKILVEMQTSRFESTDVDVFRPSDVQPDHVRVYYGEMPRKDFEAQRIDC